MRVGLDCSAEFLLKIGSLANYDEMFFVGRNNLGDGVAKLCAVGNLAGNDVF